MNHGSEKKSTRILENSLGWMKIKTQHIIIFTVQLKQCIGEVSQHLVLMLVRKKGLNPKLPRISEK